MEWLKLAFCVACMVVLLKVQGSSALKCYQCILTEKGCQDEFNKDGGVTEDTCVTGLDVCAKVKGKDTVTMRGCSSSAILGTGCNESNGVTTCTCEGDLCNGSTTVTASISIMVALALVVAIFTRM